MCVRTYVGRGGGGYAPIVSACANRRPNPRTGARFGSREFRSFPRVCVWRRGRRLSRTRARGFGTCAPPTTTRQILQQPAAMNLLLWIRAHAFPRTSSSGVHDHIRGLRAAGQTPTQIDRTACGRRAHLKRITFVTNEAAAAAARHRTAALHNRGIGSSRVVVHLRAVPKFLRGFQKCGGGGRGNN